MKTYRVVNVRFSQDFSDVVQLMCQQRGDFQDRLSRVEAHDEIRARLPARQLKARALFDFRAAAFRDVDVAVTLFDCGDDVLE
jgi:hypothetical protein